MWRLLLGYEVGLLEPAGVVLPSLPANAKVMERKAHLFGLVAGLWLAAVGRLDPMPFSVRLVCDWYGHRKLVRQVNAAIRALIDRGVIVKVGERPTSPGLRPTPYYLPGKVSDDDAKEDHGHNDDEADDHRPAPV